MGACRPVTASSASRGYSTPRNVIVSIGKPDCAKIAVTAMKLTANPPRIENSIRRVSILRAAPEPDRRPAYNASLPWYFMSFSLNLCFRSIGPSRVANSTSLSSRERACSDFGK